MLVTGNTSSKNAYFELKTLNQCFLIVIKSASGTRKRFLIFLSL